jgi:hypothetical protein
MSCGQGGDVPSNSSSLEDYMIKNIKDAELKKLIEKLKRGEKVDLNQRNTYGELPLELAFKEMYTKEIVGFLIEKGADVHITDELGNTLLMKAVSSSYSNITEVLKVLIDKGADKDVQNKEGKTALMLAASNFLCSEEVDVLVKAGADVNKQDNDGKTALHLAFLKADGYKGIAQNLLKSPQVNLLIKDKEGNLVFHALANKRSSITDNSFKNNVILLRNKMINLNLKLPENDPEWINNVWPNNSPWDLLQWSDTQRTWFKEQLTVFP